MCRLCYVWLVYFLTLFVIKYCITSIQPLPLNEIFLLLLFSIITKFKIIISTEILQGGAVSFGTALQAGRSRVLFPILSLEFFFDIILPAALWH